MHGGMGLSKNILVNQFGIVEGNQDFFHLSEGGVKLLFLATEGGQTFFNNFSFGSILSIDQSHETLKSNGMTLDFIQKFTLRLHLQLICPYQLIKNDQLIFFLNIFFLNKNIFLYDIFLLLKFLLF